MIVRNCIRECFDGRVHLTSPEELDHAVFHRISRAKDNTSPFGPIPDEDLTGPLVAAWFRETLRLQAGSYTGGQCPYHLLVRTNGQVDQMNKLSDTSPHSRRWSVHGVGVAFAGDFRHEEPTAQQSAAAEILSFWFLRARFAVGTHTFFQGPPKDCPGEKFKFEEILQKATRRLNELEREDVREGEMTTRLMALERMEGMGFVI